MASVAQYGPTYSPELQALLSSLNEHQLAAVNIGPGLSSLIGVPGSGKTRTIVARIARLVADGFDPNFVLAMTFTRSGAFEMNERLVSLGIETARVGTIHSVARQIVATETKMFEGCQLDERGRLGLELKKLLSDLRREGRIARQGDREAVKRFIEACKARGLAYVYGDPFGMNIKAETIIGREARRWSETASLTPRELALIYTEFEKRRSSRCLYDFDDMLLWCWMQLVTDEDTRSKWRNRWSVVVVDEVQDSNPVQWDISRILVGLDSCIGHVKELNCAPVRDEGLHNLMVGGDPSQCHPPGAMIEVGKTCSVPIEQLVTDQCIRGWNRHKQKMVGGRKIKIAEREYKGSILTVTTRDEKRKTKTTPNHRFLCRWTDRTSNVCVTYIMFRRDFGYRVGWCQLFCHRADQDNGLHLPIRGGIEKADAMWILHVHADRALASQEESIIAAKYGLPTITFEPVHGAKTLTADIINGVFAALRDENAIRGEHCLRDYNRDPLLPLWPWPNQPTGAYLRATYFEVYAQNLLPEVMSVPLPDERNMWIGIKSVESHPYSGKVYSLDVEEDHSYAADGIVVLNSIFGWRAAEPELFVKFSQDSEVTKLILPINYRSNVRICEVATQLVTGKPWHLGGHIIASSDCIAPTAVRSFAYGTPEEEASSVIRKCMNIADNSEQGYRACAVLSRMSVGLNLAEIECIRNRIPYIKRASGSFYESTEIRDVLAYLRVACSLDPDGRWLRHIINRPFRYIGSKFIAKAEFVSGQERTSILDAMLSIGADLTYKQLNALKDLYILLQDLNKIAVSSEGTRDDAEEDADLVPGPAKMITVVLDKTNYIEELRKEEGLMTLDESKVATLRELHRIANMFKKTSEFLGYIDALAIAVKKAQKSGLRVTEEEKKDALVLSTIHRAKGQEWDHVFLMDVVEGRFPHSRTDNLDEELRLLYVAETRARHSFAISYSTYHKGSACFSEHNSGKESSFIHTIDLILQTLDR